MSRRGWLPHPGAKKARAHFLQHLLSDWLKREAFPKGTGGQAPFLLNSAATLYYEIMSTLWHLEGKGLSFKIV